MVPKISRRDLAAALAASAALLAQQPSQPLPANPDEEMQAVRAQARQNSATLAKFDVPMPVEPAVHFQA